MVARSWALCREDTAMPSPQPAQRRPKRAVTPQNAVHAPRRHPHAVQTRAAVSDPALTTVGVAPFAEKPHDLVAFLAQQTTDHPPAKAGIVDGSFDAAPRPAPYPAAVNAPHHAYTVQGPANLGGVVKLDRWLKLHKDDRLCVPPAPEGTDADPVIVCTMGFRG